MSELPEETGDPRVDAIVGGLGRLAELPVSEHVTVFDEAFSGLEATLAAAEDAAEGAPEGAGAEAAQRAGRGPGDHVTDHAAVRAPGMDDR
ncbi:hypothetical protein HII36_50585 [Nonomuraea sp. NN258]|uniref:hypothetical protein n=1 Tax=Nonomuraea antri TaxID=2730852 RepID=UPI00156A3D49|nr:hypothetical protein [Nonomuraea antri]NRQ40020.1 hypothetical protein [Nonomuraea antri]